MGHGLRGASLFVVLLLAPCPDAADLAEYTVTFSAEDRRTVHVKADVPLDASAAAGARDMPPAVVRMHPGKAVRHLRDGWATHVRGLSATDRGGDPVAPRYLGNARWSVPATAENRVRLRYSVHLEQMKGHRHTLIKETGYVKDDLIFIATETLFIFPSGLRDTVVRFVLPRGWRVTSPWDEYEGCSNCFLVESADELSRSLLAAGTHIERTLTAEDFRLVLALSGEMAGAADPFYRLLASHVEGCSKMFGGAPAEKYVLMVSRADHIQGAAFRGGYSLMSGTPVDERNTRLWGDVLGRRVMRRWIGERGLVPASEQEAWFEVGLFDYLLNLVLVRLGHIDTAGFLHHLQEAHREYSSLSGKVSLREASRNRMRMEPLIRGGGALIAFALDVEIREGTNNRKGLDDLTRLLYAEPRGANPAIPRDRSKLRLGEIVRAASHVADRDLSEFFDTYVDGAAELPAEQYFARAGLKLEGGSLRIRRAAEEERESAPPPSPNVILQGILAGTGAAGPAGMADTSG